MIFPLILIVLSVITRVAYFGHPSAVVFDEVYNGKFVTDYATHSFYFDIHPPLGKILTYWWSTIVGTPLGVDFATIGNEVTWQVIWIRLLPILVGILVPFVVYLLCRHLKFSKLGALTAGLLVVFENSLVVQSRFVLFDDFLLLFGFLAVLLYFKFADNRAKWWLLILSCILGAMAFSVKWTGLAFPLLIVIVECVRMWKGDRRIKRFIGFLASYVVIGVLVYLSVFAIHFAYLNHSGPGDAFVSDRFQKTLIGNPHENDPIQPKRFFGKVIELNVRMYESNLTLTKPHSYSSLWYTWPFMQRTVFYWQSPENASTTDRSYIYLIGNPLIYWLSTFAILYLIIISFKKKLRDATSNFIVTGFLVNFLPFILIGRVMFLYHYEAALIFAIIAIAYLADSQKRPAVLYALIVVVFLVFLFFSPLTYGTPLSDAALHSRMWISSWR